MRQAEDQPSVNVLMRADPIVHYTIKSTVNGHHVPGAARTASYTLASSTSDGWLSA
jgi:hypothetical protein